MRLESEKNQILSVNNGHLRRPHAAVALAVVALLAGCKGEAAAPEEAVRPVKVAVVAEAPAAARSTYSGVVRSRIDSAMGFRVAGKIVERSVNVGDRVEVGQVIARLDETDLKLAETAAKAAVASARSRHDVASDQSGARQGAAAEGDHLAGGLRHRRNELDAAAAGLETAEAQLRQAANAVGYATLKADKAGLVTAVTGEPGQVVGAGQAVITLADASETEIAVAVPEQDAGRLTIGQQAKVTLWAGPRASIEGRVREIAGQADAASRTYAVRIAVNAPPQAMRLGMTALVAISVDDEAAPMVVPLTALTESGWRHGGVCRRSRKTNPCARRR